MSKYAIRVDRFRCIGCYACVVACSSWHKDSLERIKIVDVVEGSYPDLTRWIYPVVCVHCEDAPCVKACPVNAIRIRKDGIIWIDELRCIGCGECLNSCEYDTIFLNEDTGRAYKCDMCMYRIDEGRRPICVDVCPTDAIIFYKRD